MATSGFSLPDVIQSIRRHKGIIIAVTVISAIAGALFYLAGPKKYEAKTEFILRNPQYSDRINLYNAETRLFDYFANEDDIDRLILMAEADIVQSKVIKNLHLAEAYGIDVSTRKGEQQLERKFGKNFNISRTEYKDLILSYVDVDPERAATVANESERVLEVTFGNYYKEMRTGMYEAVMEKVKEEDSAIVILTDSLSKMRDQYGIYDIISPARYNLMLGSMKGNGKKDFGKAMELIQNTESIKDEVVAQHTKHLTLVNQYKTGLRAEQLPMLKVVTVAKNPVSPKGIGGLYTLLACAFLGFFFSTSIMLLVDNSYFKLEQ
jgi:capsular polysaccharide biosynthesis protein